MNVSEELKHQCDWHRVREGRRQRNDGGREMGNLRRFRARH